MSQPLPVRVAMLPPKVNPAQAPSSRYQITNGESWEVQLTIGPDIYRGTLHNLSTSGIGILTPDAPPIDMEALADVANRDTRLTLRQLVRIVHTTPLARGGYLTGCEFYEPLPYHQVRALVG